ncbi:uncharacterized protein LOC131882505 [Tigriopus californicus]|uniref:uncharacterized protein LOC131882505 n=1 Tax=Tigriopus californicus TaxID=6832 RepID=UPI0027DA62DA|nr:uncharacterized protein LOC131882505 [Tigriopus californicus]
MRWYIVPLTYLVIGLYNVHGCVENHVQCLKSFQWKYRAFRTFHHISNAETCQAACSRYSSRLNYFSFDVSIHRCICLANCLIHRGDDAQNDVTGTVSDVDPSELCQVPENQDTQGQQVQEDPLKLLFFDNKRIFSFNSQTKELRTITSFEEKYLNIKAVTKVNDKLFSMVTEDQSPDGREQRGNS